MNVTYRANLIRSLTKLGGLIRQYGIPPEVVETAIAQNPWFTKYYIQTSLESLLNWMHTKPLSEFLLNYELRQKPPARIGLILSGNIPFAGFHDLLITVLSGNIALVKTSHQDDILIRWIVELWMQDFPHLKSQIQFTHWPESPDFILASGSNNTARYIQAAFKDIPAIVRKNRFSIAVIDSSADQNKLEALSHDLFLYNGLGCRNVSNLIIEEGLDIAPLLRKWSVYESRLINPHYLKKVRQETARMEMTGVAFYQHPYALFQPIEEPTYARMGIIYMTRFRNKTHLEQLLNQQTFRIQCVVGLNTPFGKTQQPGLVDFADGIDSMEILLNVDPAEKSD